MQGYENEMQELERLTKEAEQCGIPRRRVEEIGKDIPTPDSIIAKIVALREWLELNGPQYNT